MSLRSLRESLADAERSTSREKEDSDTEADSESTVRRDAVVPRRDRTDPIHQPCRARHGLRPDRSQRRDRTDRSGIEERNEREEALERDVDQDETRRHEVARSATL